MLTLRALPTCHGFHSPNFLSQTRSLEVLLLAFNQQTLASIQMGVVCSHSIFFKYFLSKLTKYPSLSLFYLKVQSQLCNCQTMVFTGNLC